MSLLPKLAFQRIGSPASLRTLEVYIDFLCPFSAKIVKSLDENVIPHVKEGGRLYGKVQLILRLQPQPWHATSTYLHEAAIAFGLLSPEDWWSYAVLVMQQQETFFDIPSENLSSVQIRKKLVGLAEKNMFKFTIGKDGQDSGTGKKMLDLLTPKDSPNGGNGTTDLLKYNIKLGRQNGIHVTPTALFNGLVDSSISSSFGAEDWEKWFGENVNNA